MIPALIIFSLFSLAAGIDAACAQRPGKRYRRAAVALAGFGIALVFMYLVGRSCS